MLAYTNRFLTLATIIRNLYDRYNTEKNQNLLGQIANLRFRVYLIDPQYADLWRAKFTDVCGQHVRALRRLGYRRAMEFCDCFDVDDRFDVDLIARVADLSGRVGLVAH